METRGLIVVALVWVVVGVTVAIVMRRRGHDLYVWLALGTVLGPLIIPLAIERARFHGVADQRTASLPTPPRRGFDVLAGVDGSEESLSALASAVELFGESITSLTVATVLDYDSESAAAGVEPREEAQAMLDEIAAKSGVGQVRTEILFGRADRALAEYARTHGAELIVVGARGHGATEALLGSVTARLVGSCEVPVHVGASSTGRRPVPESATVPGATA